MYYNVMHQDRTLKLFCWWNAGVLEWCWRVKKLHLCKNWTRVKFNKIKLHGTSWESSTCFRGFLQLFAFIRQSMFVAYLSIFSSSFWRGWWGFWSFWSRVDQCYCTSTFSWHISYWHWWRWFWSFWLRVDQCYKSYRIFVNMKFIKPLLKNKLLKSDPTSLNAS